MRTRLLFLSILLLCLNFAKAQFPIITSFSPSSGTVGTVVTITGANFNPVASGNIVFFGATRASVNAASANSLTVAVPVGATYAPITVLNTVTALTAYTSTNFLVTSNPNKSTISTSDFSPKVDFASGNNPLGISVGDLDGDGKPDVVLSNHGSNNISVLRNTGSSGTVAFANKVDLATGVFPWVTAIGDIDGDGKLDLAVANVDEFFVAVFRNTSSIGTISFAPRVDINIAQHPYNIAIGDINADGKPDVVTANNYAGTTTVLRNTSSVGTISFASKVDFTVGINPYCVAIGDINGDGSPELVTANLGANTVSVLRNTSSGNSISFATKVDFLAGAYPYYVAIGDLDGDGKQDLAVANFGSSSSGGFGDACVLRNESTTTTLSFETRISLATGADTHPRSIAIGDLNGDGKPDLATANNENTISVFCNKSIIGVLMFTAKADIVGGASSIAIADIDGDGKQDVAVASTGDACSVYRNGPTFSNNINLSSLTISSGTLSPIFASATTAYTASVANAVASVTVTPTVTDVSATVQVRVNTNSFVTVISGNASSTLPLNVGNNTIDVKVTVLDGLTVITKTYTITVARAAAVPVITSFVPSSGPIGSLVTITGTDLNNPTALTIGGVGAIIVSNTGTSLVALVMPGAVTGNIGITTAGGTANSSSNFTIVASVPPAAQQGGKLVGTGMTGSAQHGWSINISADGNTAIVGGDQDNSGKGAAWIYTRSGTVWSQQGNKLVGTGSVGQSAQGTSVSLSADGNTAIVGGYNDNAGVGAAWIYTRSGGTWTQQGNKLIGAGAVGASSQGSSVSMSADGNTIIIGGQGDNSTQGAAWIFTRSAGVWTQQWNKLVGTGSAATSGQGSGVSLSADGNTAMVGAYNDNSGIGAAWIYTRSAGAWSQQGNKLVGTGNVGLAQQGVAVSLSADGNTAIAGGYVDNGNKGAAWIYTRSAGVWSQQGNKLAGTGNVGSSQQGWTVGISADGNTAIVGGWNDNSNVGAAWVYTRTAGTWSQQGSKRVGADNSGSSRQGSSVSISADGNTMAIGGYTDNAGKGAAWVFNGALSNNNADLSSLILSTGAFNPIFASAITAYTDSVINSVTTITVTPTITHPNATIEIRINGGTYTALTSGNTSSALNLIVGVNTIDIKVTAQEGTTIKIYSIAVTRLPLPAITSFTPSTGPVGTVVTITGTNLDNPTALTIGGVSPILISNTGTSLLAMVMPGTVTGNISISTIGGGSTSGSNFTVVASVPPNAQQGDKLVGTGSVGTNVLQGCAVALSADGNTAVVGAYGDNNYQGAAWVYKRTNGVWAQQGNKLVGTGGTTGAYQGSGVAISADANTILVGGHNDNTNKGAVWVYINNNGVWQQQGNKLVGSGSVGACNQGWSIGLTPDGNTAVIGGQTDNSDQGAIWVFTRSSGVWAQQGNKLTCTGSTGPARLGTSVKISADGNTIVAGGVYDNSYKGAVWVFVKSGNTWVQQGTKLVGTGSVTSVVHQGKSVAISADGNTIAFGGPEDYTQPGATWVFTRTGTTWTQQGSRIIGTGYAANFPGLQGNSVSLSADGNELAIGGMYADYNMGAVWVFKRSAGVWTQTWNKLVGSNAIVHPSNSAVHQGSSVCFSADGNTLMFGGMADNNYQGAAWVYNGVVPPPAITSFSPSSGPVGSLVTITGTNLSNPSALTIGGVSAIPISNTGTGLVAMVMPGTVTGAVSVTTENGSGTSSGNFTVVAALPPNAQQGNKLVGTGGLGASNQGYSVAISADGNTAILGGTQDNGLQGGAWIFTRNSGVWTQQGSKLVGTGSVGNAQQGESVAISADGNIAVVGAAYDNGGIGAAWVFVRNGNTWAQQGGKLVGTGYIGNSQQGISVSISASGNKIIVGGAYDNSNIGAAWFYTRSAGVWVQTGTKLVGSGYTGQAQQGWSVAISADGNTAIVGGFNDNLAKGAVWVYVNNGSGGWAAQGSKLVGTGTVGSSYQGTAVSLSADGNTALVGGVGDNSTQGAAWVFTRTGVTWTQQGNKLVGTGTIGNARQGQAVSLSADGNTALIGGYADNSNLGASWLYKRSGGTWTQQGSKLVGTGNVGNSQQGLSVSLSADGSTAMVGGYGDDLLKGAVWMFSYLSLPATITTFKAFQKTTGIQVEWNTQNEINLVSYEVEKSTDGSSFTKAGTIAAKGLATYNWVDANPTNGNNYYRLKMIDKDGSFKYSSIVNVKIGAIKNVFTIAGNPIKNNTLVLQMENVEKGNYGISIYNNLGQLMVSKTIVHAGGSATQTLYLGNVSAGTYQLSIIGSNVKINKTIMVE